MSNRISFETVGSIVAIVVGVAALFVAWDEAKSVRKQQAASVLPILKVYTLYVSEEEGYKSAVIVENVGVGPAFIENARSSWSGESLQSIRAGLRHLPDAQNLTNIWTSPLYGEIVAGDSQYEYVSAIMPTDKISATYVNELKNTIASNLKIEACYCSIYNDCWKTSLNKDGRPEPVKTCKGEGW